MKDYKLQDRIVAEKITKEEVNRKNITLCVTNNHLNVDFGNGAWDGVAKKIISSCRKK